MSIMNMLNGLVGGANPTTSTGSNSGVSAPAPAHAQSNQAQVLSQVPDGAGRDTGVMLAQVPQASQAPQAQSPEAQIKSLFATLNPMKALSLLRELLAMLGMGQAPAAKKPGQAQLGQAPQPQDLQTLQAIDKVMAQLGQGQAPQAQDPQTLQAIDQVMAQLGQGQAPQVQDPQTLQAIDQVMAQLGLGQAPQAQDPQNFEAMIKDIANQTFQPPQTFELASKNAENSAKKP